MAYDSTTGIISAPVDFRDVQKALGTSKTYLNELCTHKNINVWAKYKPVPFDQIDTTKHATSGQSWLNNDKTWNGYATWWKYRKLDWNVNTDTAYRCGFTVPRMPIVDMPSTGIGKWTFHRPRGQGADTSGSYFEPYRLIDFNQYYNRAVCPFNIKLPEVATQPLFNDGKISASISKTLDPLNLTLNDIIATTGTTRVGIKAFDKNGVWKWRTQVDLGNGNFSPTITLQGCVDKNYTGKLMLVAFATDKDNTNWTNSPESGYAYSLDAPNIPFEVIGECIIKPQPKITYDIVVSLPSDAPKNDKDFVMDIFNPGENGGIVSGYTKTGQSSNDHLWNEYTLAFIQLRIYRVSDTGALETLWTSNDFVASTLNAGDDLNTERYVRFRLHTRELSYDSIPEAYREPSYNTMRQYIFKYSY